MYEVPTALIGGGNLNRGGNFPSAQAMKKVDVVSYEELKTLARKY